MTFFVVVLHIHSLGVSQALVNFNMSLFDLFKMFFHAGGLHIAVWIGIEIVEARIYP